MPLTLVTTAPDGTTTRNRPVMYGPQAAIAVASILRDVAPWLTRRQADCLGLRAVHVPAGTTFVHDETGYRFRIETEKS